MSGIIIDVMDRRDAGTFRWLSQACNIGPHPTSLGRNAPVMSCDVFDCITIIPESPLGLALTELASILNI